MAKTSSKYRSFEFHGYKIEYSKFQKRWFAMDYDWELGWHDVMSKPTKNEIMNWIQRNIGAL